ncbi:hypothetical protein P7K49_010977 [Saguinus oedipus]|uniref:Uncharacterized protein n=1 Tax=Saguinus oedipus TaxID=9490 RepID=A0ABQ9VQ14_SAGOE|nr:hypothetical protein P7K49_010977 [Saguinus oedipus]
MWTNGSQPCVHLQAQIQIRVMYTTQGGGEDLQQRAVYLSYMAMEYNVTFSQAAPVHLDLLSLRVQAAQLPHTGVFGPTSPHALPHPDVNHHVTAVATYAILPPGFSCPSDRSILLPLIIGLILLGLLALVLIAFCIVRRRPSAYQPL